MPTGHNKIYVEISPTRRQALVMRAGKVVDSRVERVEAGPPQANAAVAQRRWSESIASFQTTLAKWALELGITGSQATVVYSGPDCSASVYSCPVNAGAGGARQAAELALSEAVSFPLENAAFDISHVLTDRKGGVGADGSPKSAMIHHLAAADTDFSTSELCACVQSAGLLPVELIPGSAAMLHSASNLAIARASGETTSLIIWIGEQGAVLACAGAQRLAFVRFLGVGTEMLVDAITRPTPGKAPGTPGSAMDRAAARELLFTTGIPNQNETESGESMSADAAHLLPLMRPVLQRLAIELKQSLRFGLTSDERAGLRVYAAGPGAGIRNLVQILAWDAGVEEPIDMTDVPEAPAEVLRGETFAALARKSSGSGLNLLPRSMKAVAHMRGMRRALWVGVATAALAVITDGVQTRMAVVEQREILTRLEEQAARPDPTRDAMLKIVAAQQGMTMAKARIRQRLARSPEAAATLAMLVGETPANVRLKSIQLSLDQGEWKARITGIARAEADTAPAQLVKQFIDRLESAPLVTHAHLGATQLSQGAAQQTLSFDISFGLVGLPRDGSDLFADPIAGAEQTGDRP